ncbi:Gx transporter family protein [bacterium]|nr:Gx transporter family protein [FCB group bacterium]MBL7190394.1 Gx transporter family protein [bacterium]
MRQPVSINGILKVRRLTIIPLLSAGGAVIFVFESMIPQPLPFAKLGLSNIAPLIALYIFGLPEALAVGWLRIIIGGLFSGSLFSPAFILGFSGSGAAVLTMYAGLLLGRERLSPVGVSVLGAAGHNIAQVITAGLLFVGHHALWNILPFMLLFAAFTGAFVGIIAWEILERMKLID